MLSAWLFSSETLFALTQSCGGFQEDFRVSFISLWFCLSVATSFVLSLYLVVPRSIRQLDREDPRQIRWRGVAVSLVCLLSTLFFAKVFCSANHSTESDDGPSALDLMGYSMDIRPIFGALLHVSLLYLGPFTASFLQVVVFRQRMHQQRDDSKGLLHLIWTLKLRPLLSPFLSPVDDSERWSHIRNVVLAPLTEEIAFRGCMAFPMLATGYSTPQVSFLAPLFFGVAHIHHAALKIHQGFSVSQVLLLTVFQFAYTTLFGAYATYVLIRTSSLFAAVAIHAFCNIMGLPDLSFFEPTGKRLSRLYPYRWFLVGIYISGVGAFAWAFTTDQLLPLPPKLLEHVFVH